MPHSTLHEPVLRWYAQHARELPWRRPDASPWEVLVSEVMLQQTPVTRVLPVFAAWMARWPTPAGLAAEPAGESVRQWGRLGYPRRALALHRSARLIVERHGGEVPDRSESLGSLPGVGSYTAAAVAAFAFGRREVVLDTNVRRVLARVVTGAAFPARQVNAAERQLAEALLPDAGPDAARWSVAAMELGALVCRARSPQCGKCPVASHCRWAERGDSGPGRSTTRPQRYHGTDRQCRGRLLALLRDHPRPATSGELEQAWQQAGQRERALAGLITDGLVQQVGADSFSLPT
jgi:A/G-specific adenine glycosylase